MDRREALRWLAAAMTAPLGGGVAACSRSRQGTMAGGTTSTSAGGAPESKTTSGSGAVMPVVFIAHGAPPLLDDEGWKAELATWAKAMPKPKAILSLSAHWEAHPIAIGATRPLPLVYDFYGFPERYYTLQYPAPGAPAVAARIRELLREHGIAFVDDPERGLDHGTYVPLMSMYPDADVPVLQVSLPGLDPKELHAFGRALAPLRDEGVLIAGSGFLTHNMRSFGERSTPAWAREFDEWCADVLAKHDVDALVDFKRRSPSARLAHPREEHFAPVITAAAAALDRRGEVKFPITGYWRLAPAFTRRTVQFG
jgi:4,5-DOPA dioxygenase extradiol